MKSKRVITFDYLDKLKDPRWQKRRLELLNKGNWICTKCGDENSTLHVHHTKYLPDREPWEYPDELFKILCENCHKIEKEQRLKQEKILIDSLKIIFYSEDLKRLSEGFYSLQNDVLFDEDYNNSPGMISATISWILSDKNTLNFLAHQYRKTMLNFKKT